MELRDAAAASETLVSLCKSPVASQGARRDRRNSSREVISPDPHLFATFDLFPPFVGSCTSHRVCPARCTSQVFFGEALRIITTTDHHNCGSSQLRIITIADHHTSPDGIPSPIPPSAFDNLQPTEKEKSLILSLFDKNTKKKPFCHTNLKIHFSIQQFNVSSKSVWSQFEVSSNSIEEWATCSHSNL